MLEKLSPPPNPFPSGWENPEDSPSSFPNPATILQVIDVH